MVSFDGNGYGLADISSHLGTELGAVFALIDAEGRCQRELTADTLYDCVAAFETVMRLPTLGRGRTRDILGSYGPAEYE